MDVKTDASRATQRPGWYVLDELGHAKPVDLHTWTSWYVRNNTYLWETKVRPKGTFAAIVVITEFMGIDHAKAGIPQLFKTTIRGGLRHGEILTYGSYADAEVGHRNLIGTLSLERGK